MMLDSLKHTPGPWKIDFGHPRGQPGGISATNDGRIVTRFGTFARPSTPEALANAALISAAPDMLDALWEAKGLADMAEMQDGPGEPSPDQAILIALRSKIDAAIAKAVGRIA